MFGPPIISRPCADTAAAFAGSAVSSVALSASSLAPVLSASALVPKVLDWRRQFASLDRLLRQLVWVYGAYIVLMITGLGLLA